VRLLGIPPGRTVWLEVISRNKWLEERNGKKRARGWEGVSGGVRRTARIVVAAAAVGLRRAGARVQGRRLAGRHRVRPRLRLTHLPLSPLSLSTTPHNGISLISIRRIQGRLVKCHSFVVREPPGRPEHRHDRAWRPRLQQSRAVATLQHNGRCCRSSYVAEAEISQ